MLARRQVVIVTELESVEQMPERERDAEIQNLGDYFKDPAPFTVLILEANQLDQRMKFARMLSEQALVLAAELPEDPRERSRLAATLASQMARDRNSAIEDDAADALADLCNGDLGAIQSEIDKLATYAGAGKAIRRVDVEALVVAEKKSTVWELADVLAARQRERAFRFLANVWQQGESAPALIGAMAWMCRKLIEAQQLSPQAAYRLKMRGAEAAIRNSRKIPRRQLVEGLRALYDADSSVKGGSPDDRAVMEFMLVRLLGSPGKAGNEPDRVKAGNSKPGV
jgi:DNA polymerase-3 subunit delta